MGSKAKANRPDTVRAVRATRLSAEEQARLRSVCRYLGNAQHKKDPHNFDLIPPSNPRPDKTLCDLAGVFDKAEADRLFELAIAGGLVSAASAAYEFPKQLWCVDERASGRQVFEFQHGGNTEAPDGVRATYHGYPIRSSDPLHVEILAVWK